ncbi:Glyco hydro 18 domain containing protein, partial [Asbolus verrucosus]
KIIGYYKSWEAHIFPPENVDINTYTHINYAFLGINEDGSIRFEGSEDVVRRLSYLKGRNSRLKVLFSIGGWNEGSRKFSLVAADANKTLRFANDVVSYLNKYNFDGVDVDWEYPGENGGCPADKNNFVNLLTTLRKELNRNGSYLLTIAVSPLADPNSYDIPAISRVVDCIKVMTYDFHQAAEGKTGQNAPLYASSMDSDWQRQNCNCHAGINKWISGGAPSTKVILGLAFYGQEYNLTTRANGLGAPTSTTGGQITYK